MDLASIYERCVSGLKKFMDDAGFSDAVIGLSGGMDSSLVAVMAVDALGADNVHGVLLPGPYSSDASVSDALLLADALGIETFKMPISLGYDAIAKTYEGAVGESLSGLASENTQARLRMVFIMALSNRFGWMMLNTGNRSEAAMGYSTLYGDTAGAFAPIGGIYKSDVYLLAEWRNERSRIVGDKPLIPINVFEKPPSAELSENQSDEASMGITYRDLDRILKACIQCNDESFGSDLSDVDPGLIDMVKNRYESYAFKRALEPPFVDAYDDGSSDG